MKGGKVCGTESAQHLQFVTYENERHENCSSVNIFPAKWFNVNTVSGKKRKNRTIMHCCLTITSASTMEPLSYKRHFRANNVVSCREVFPVSEVIVLAWGQNKCPL